MNKDFWKEKTVLVTGHTGFKGSWLSLWLRELGAKVVGFSLDSTNKNNNYDLSGLGSKIVDLRGDIRKISEVREAVEKYEVDIVFHLAAQALVGEGYKSPIENYETNVMGTLNVLQTLRESKRKVVGVFITTDKVYENKDSIWGYREFDEIGGYDPYSSSKGCCELLIKSFRNSYFNLEEYDIHKKSISAVRAGNVIGGGDWSRNRLIPDVFRAIEEGKELIIRKPKGVRPWQHVLEPLAGYINLSEKMWNDPLKFSGEWNFGPNLDELYDVSKIVWKVNELIGNKLKIKIEENEEFHESNILLLDITKSRVMLNWKPLLNIDNALEFTAEWYKDYKHKSVYDICINQIKKYMKMLEGES